MCATTGGITVSCVPTYSDLGEDVDNCPVNMKELKHLDSWECKLSFTSLGTSAESIRMALGAADINAESGAIVPRRSLKQTDFSDLWWVGDKADGGMVAVQLLNALSTAGFSLKTTKNGKGQVTVELTGHVSINAQDTMPMVFYVFNPVTVAPESPSVELFNTPVSDIQTDVSVNGNAITGTLHYLDDGEIAGYWGNGNFLALKFSGFDANATSVKVGLNPSEGSGLVEILTDPDKNGVFKVTNKETQEFVVVTTDGVNTMTQRFDLSGLTVENS